MAEEIGIQPEVITEEEPEIGFLDRLKIYKFKILGGILGVLVFTGAVFGVYRFNQKQAQLTPKPTPIVTPTPAPDSTAGWRTYSNFSLGISFRYPEDWEVELVESTLHINPQEGSFTIVAYSIDDQTLRATKETYVTTDTQTVIQRRINHAEYDITEYTLTFKDVPGAGRSTIIDIVEYKDGAFLWQLSDLQFKEIFNLMLSTFRSLEDESCREMSLLEATEIALESECVEEGGLTNEFFCNQNTGTWWLDLDIEKPGCAPACVVDVSSGEAEINWRCTGLIPPEERTYCEEPRPQLCTMECIVNPPYICGSDGKSYCSECQACADPDIEWYVMQDAPCGLGEAATKEECIAKGGEWRGWGGLLPQEYCQIPAEDGGKSCLDGSECSLGRCISRTGGPPGQCQTFRNIFGCFSSVENGKIKSTVCVD